MTRVNEVAGRSPAGAVRGGSPSAEAGAAPVPPSSQPERRDPSANAPGLAALADKRLRRSPSMPLPSSRAPRRSAPPGREGTAQTLEFHGRADEAPQGPLQAAIESHMEDRWTEARSSAYDQVSFNYLAEERRDILADLPGGAAVARQYGLHTTGISRPMDQREGLRLHNDDSSGYHRSGQSEGFGAACLELHARRLGPGAKPADPARLCFVNSRQAIERLQLMMNREDLWSLQGALPEPRARQLGPGLWSLEFPTPFQAEAATSMRNGIGGTPSLYGVLRLAHADEHETVELDRTLRNDRTLAALLAPQAGEGLAALAKLPAGHSAKPMADAVVAMSRGLGAQLARLGDNPRFRHDMLLGESLRMLTALTRALPTLTEDPAHFRAAYQAVIEEVHLLLGRTRPYGVSDFKAVSTALLHERSGHALDDPRIAAPEVHLAAGGMDALSQSLHIAAALSGSPEAGMLLDQPDDSLPDYFAVPAIINQRNPNAAVLNIALNSTTPRMRHARDEANRWDAQRLVDAVAGRLAQGGFDAGKPLFLVVDNTLEHVGADGRSDLAEAMGPLKEAIADGRLRIFLCKSTVKYASLGSAKIMSGSVAFIGRDDAMTREAVAQLRAVESDMDGMANEDSQLLTHFMTHAAASEGALLRSAADNARFVHEHCFGAASPKGTGFDRFQPGLPFGLVTDPDRTITLRDSAGRPTAKVPWSDFLAGEIQQRSSFGFSETVHCATREGKRIALGQESRAELAERLYAAGWLYGRDTGSLQTQDFVSEMRRVMDGARAEACHGAGMAAWGEVALDLLRERAGRVQGPSRAQAEAIHAQCRLAWESLRERGPEALEQIRPMLQQALQVTAPLSANPVADDLKIVDAATAPRLPGTLSGSTDVAALRHGLVNRPTGSTASTAQEERHEAAVRYAPNKLASLMAAMGARLPASPDDAHAYAQQQALFDGVLATGLRGLSPTSRTLLARQANELNLRGAGAPGPAMHYLEGVLRHARLMARSEDKARALQDVPASLFEWAPEPIRRRLVDELFMPLDPAAREAFIGEQTNDGGNPRLGAMCREASAAQPDQVDRGLEAERSDLSLQNRPAP